MRGGFTCDCADGFALSPDGTSCVDVDECAAAGFCPAPGVCQNTLGSAVCTCPKGFKLEGANCVDVNECAENRGFCADGFCKNEVAT